MTTLAILGGIALGLASLAGLLLAFGYLARSLAVPVKALGDLLPPVSQFMGDVAQIREWKAREMDREARGGSVPEWRPMRTTPPVGVAPAPVNDTSATEVVMPPVNAGDQDIFDPRRTEDLMPREFAPGSKWVQPPPGPAMPGEER